MYCHSKCESIFWGHLYYIIIYHLVKCIQVVSSPKIRSPSLKSPEKLFWMVLSTDSPLLSSSLESTSRTALSHTKSHHFVRLHDLRLRLKLYLCSDGQNRVTSAPESRAQGLISYHSQHLWVPKHTKTCSEHSQPLQVTTAIIKNLVFMTGDTASQR